MAWHRPSTKVWKDIQELRKDKSPSKDTKSKYATEHIAIEKI
jgi:hypothetical protein